MSFRGRGPSEYAERITEVILSCMEAYIPLSFPSTKLTNICLTMFVLAIFPAGMLPSGITVVFELQKIMLLIFHPGIVQNLSFVTLKTPFSVENAIIFLVPLLHVLSGILQKMSTLTLLLPLSLL